ncbi:hypothetical protein LTR10_013291 [Elasticomyces elasticus]|uniref:Uncharacterized protein n=1 Tax=Exophiala sideris TaxID=1016849 RepID=A0ABR0J597_9EURO|nr:hypothetical protein LTR10_013291 [Elasticomyces elasticus]KAK5027481.1 hypothetical protein LTS07_007083 [Exophiala sideris]KAK5034815.1 hypothetical protein LTR13_005997 [Exophiala sideris]KAK5056448.1 hypothetical protein LTR69_007989 [Exophiala sideris]KAK5181061.1 hypothetical protein LTR44_006392 [Eurotiomycetes sp. CCFEE 6388]
MQPSSLTLRTDVYGSITPAGLRDSLVGKVALVTGSSRGIGRHIALALAQAGASVAVTGRDEKAVRKTCEEVSSYGTKCAPFTADVLDDKAMKRLAKDVEEQLGPIDILVLSAGSNTFMPFHHHDAQSWWDLMELNVRAPVSLTRHVLPSMKQRNSGTIVFLSSRAAVADLPWTTAYNCSKVAVTKFVGSLQAELEVVQKVEGGFEANGIQLFSIHPGEIETDLHQTAFPENLKNDAPYVLDHMAKIGAKRPHFSPDLPAWTVVFLATGKAKALQGKYVDCTRDVEEAIRLQTS